MVKTKVSYVGIAVAVLVVIIGGLVLSGCNTNKSSTKATPQSAKPSAAAPSKPNSGQTASGSKAEQAYVELAAQSNYHDQKNDQNVWTSQNAKDLCAKYGVTLEEVGAFSKALRNDPAHAKAVSIKFLRRIQELQKTGK